MIAEVATVLCIVALVGTSLVHSILGERRLVGPLLRQRGGVLDFPLARFLIRSVWHFMTILFWIIAAGLASGLREKETAFAGLLVATAIGIGGAGIYDAIGSRGKHIGWPMLVAIGILATVAAFSSR